MFMLLVIACSKVTYDQHDHSPEIEEAHGHAHEEGEIESVKFTVFSSLHELFAEVTPLIKGHEGQFTVHFTKLTNFKPVTTGSLKIILQGDINEIIEVDTIARAGIFIASYTPKSVGNVAISFVYTDGKIIDTIKVPTQKCYSSLEEAKKEEVEAEKGITFLKEESWKIDFALLQVKPADFSETVKATGKIINNPADEIIITASTSGVVLIQDNTLIPGKKIGSGAKMFVIKPGSIREDNMELKYLQAKSNFDRAKKEYDRISELYKLKITSESEYLDAKSSFENAEAVFRNYSQSSEGKSITVKSPKSGILRQIMVHQGQFVEAGTTLAIIANNNKLMVQVDLPANEYTRLSKLSDANFVIDNKTFKLKDLNGKISGTTVSSGSSGFVSVYFQIENNLNLMPNSYVTAYLFGSIISNSVTVPKEALWEDQGNYYVFVQKHGELFEKREVTIAGFDGINYLIGSGLSIVDVLVSKGAYRVMLASKTSELPAQSHAH
jgi:RND family efflux transporter MFP subunit